MTKLPTKKEILLGLISTVIVFTPMTLFMLGYID